MHADHDVVMAAPAPFGAAPEPSPWAALSAPPPALGAGPAPGPRRRRRGLVLGIVAGLVVLAGVTGAGANFYAEQQVCAGLSDSSADDTTTDLHTAAADMRASARMLIFNDDLRTAINGMADDADKLAALQQAVGAKTATRQTVGELVLVAGSVNSHARQAQEACGLPAVGVFSSTS